MKFAGTGLALRPVVVKKLSQHLICLLHSQMLPDGNLRAEADKVMEKKKGQHTTQPASSGGSSSSKGLVNLIDVDDRSVSSSSKISKTWPCAF